MQFPTLLAQKNRTWRDNWNAIDCFLREWFEIDYQRAADSPRRSIWDELSGQPIPPSVLQWLTFVDAEDQLEDCFQFRDDTGIEDLKHHNAVSLLQQGEGDAYWAVDRENLAQDDPPVTLFCFDYDNPDGVTARGMKNFFRVGTWEPSVSAFAFDHLLSYMNSRGGMYGISTSSEEYCYERLTDDFGPSVHFGNLELFVSDACLVKLPHTDDFRSKSISVEIRTKMGAHQLPDSVRSILHDSHWHSWG